MEVSESQASSAGDLTITNRTRSSPSLGPMIHSDKRKKKIAILRNGDNDVDDGKELKVSKDFHVVAKARLETAFKG